MTEAVTIKRFPRIVKSGAKAGHRNPDFLDADLFATAFLKPCEDIWLKVDVLMLEFSHFSPSDYESGSQFLADLDGRGKQCRQ